MNQGKPRTKTYLCYWELHVDDRTFLVHTLVSALSREDAVARMESKDGDNYSLQAKGCLGEFTEDVVREFMTMKEDGMP